MYESAPGITITENSLTLHNNVLRPDDIMYEHDTTSGVLTRSINGVVQSLVIYEGLDWFSPEITMNGVVLHLAMSSSDNYITITNETFILTRN